MLYLRRKRRTSVVVKAALFCFALYATVTLVQLQLDINRKNNELEEINHEIEAVEQENAALRESLELGTTDAYIASVARDNGYAVSGERVMIDTSSK